MQSVQAGSQADRQHHNEHHTQRLVGVSSHVRLACTAKSGAARQTAIESDRRIDTPKSSAPHCAAHPAPCRDKLPSHTDTALPSLQAPLPPPLPHAYFPRESLGVSARCRTTSATSASVGTGYSISTRRRGHCVPKAMPIARTVPSPRPLPKSPPRPCGREF